MVVDMLTSPQEQIPAHVSLMEEDVQNSLCASHHSDHHLHPVPHTAVFHCSDEPGTSSASRSRRTVRRSLCDGAKSSEQQRMSFSSEKDSMESRRRGDEGRHRLHEDKTKLCKRKLDLTSLSSGSPTKAQVSEKKDLESPPPGKRWVIGPLFQSFKSKMASFTEIVMSPVRLFKPSELLAESSKQAPSVTHEYKEDVGAPDVFSKTEETVTHVPKLPLIQRLRFETSPSDLSDSEKVSEHTDSLSVPGDDGSFGLLNSPRSTNQITEAVTTSDVQQHNTEEDDNCESVHALPHTGLTDSVRSSCKKEPESAKAVCLFERKASEESKQAGKNKDQGQDQPLAKRVRLPTPAIGKRRKGRGLRTSERIETFERESVTGADVAEESPTITQTKKTETLVQTGKRRKVQVSDVSRRTSLRSCDSSEREKTAQTRASRSRSEREKGVKCSFVSKPVRKSNVRQSKHKSVTPAAKNPQVGKKCANTRRVKRDVDPFDDQGMSMSLTLKVGSGLDREQDITCGIRTKSRTMGEDLILAEASCPSRTTPEKDNRLTDDGHLDKADMSRRLCVYLGTLEIQEELDEENSSKPGMKSGRGANRLKRSLSCPDITSLQRASDTPVNDRTLHPSPLKRAPHSNGNVPSPMKRARRHTVCSLEIEREIAPLCLRKEVYPKWGSVSSNSYPPSKSWASLVSCFLSSPLAFLSKKSIRGHGDDGECRGSSSDHCVTSSSSQPLLNSPTSSGVTSGSTFFKGVPHTPEQSSSHCSVFDDVSTEDDGGLVRQEHKENARPSAVSEETTLSDSEIKTDSKRIERRKVSSIRIRKTLPKPQYNLTPMGLPKAVRIKKKVFSVEEIYTNKNFTKPVEGRLETIFETPLRRRDGSVSLIGPKRVKRFVEFPELGVARKPRKPLVGGAGGVGAQRKSAGNSGTGRTRRGREEEPVHLQDFDSLLCSKLNELDVWMAAEQTVY